MRIIILTSSNSHSGGVRQAVYQARTLHERGHEVSLCLPHDSYFWQEKPAPYWVALPADTRQWAKVLERLFLPHGPTIIHAFHRAVNFCAWHGLFWRRHQVYCVSHRGVLFRPKNFLVYWLWGIAAVAANSRACAQSFAWACPRSKLHVIPNGLPPERISPRRSREEIVAELGLAANTFAWGYVGNDNPVKGLDIALQALAQTPHGDLLVIGTKQDHQARCSELGISSRVHFLGVKNHVVDYMQAMDALVFSSYGMDSMPNVIMEAMGMHVPVVSSKVGGVEDTLPPHYPAPALVPIKDIPALATAMRRVVEDTAFRQSLISSIQSVLPYTMERRCEELEQLYGKIVER